MVSTIQIGERWLSRGAAAIGAAAALFLAAAPASAISTVFRLDPTTGLARGGSGIAVGTQVALLSLDELVVDITFGPLPDMLLLDFQGVVLPTVSLGLQERLGFELLDGAGRPSDSFTLMAQLADDGETWHLNPALLPIRMTVEGFAGHNAIHEEIFSLPVSTQAISSTGCASGLGPDPQPVEFGTGDVAMVSSVCLTAFDLNAPLIFKLEGTIEENGFPFPAHMPEPGSGVLAGLGVAALAAWARRRRAERA